MVNTEWHSFDFVPKLLLMTFSRKNVSRNDLCVDLIPYWHIAVDRITDGKVDIDTTVSLIRSCCKLQRCGSAVMKLSYLTE